MTCEEFQRVLPELEGGHNFEQEQHLKACSRCSELISDLSAISQQARLIGATTEEPSPRVWNSIEITLRQEGLIHEPSPVAGRARVTSWRLSWLVPALAALLVVFGVVLHRPGKQPSRSAMSSPPVVKAVEEPGPELATLADEEQLLGMVAARAPALRADYESDLRAVDEYIRDAERSARSNPNDELAQQYLMNAYEQRAMVYEMAMDRTLP